MTSNQRRAVTLARQVCAGRLSTDSVTDGDWHLLLLAADVPSPQSLPLLVCHRVLDRARRGEGYFAKSERLGEGETTSGGAPWGSTAARRGRRTGPHAAPAPGPHCRQIPLA
jgi:hypothetical protein